MPLAPGLATWLVEQGHDAVHARQLGLDRAPDTEILERARIDNRVIVTADLDYPRLLACARAEGPGLILFRGGEYNESETVERLSAALQSIPEEDLTHSIVVIERKRMRRRRLPIGPE